MSEQLPQLNVTSTSAARLSYQAASNAIIEKCQLTDFKDKNTVIKTLYSGISRGTESLVYHGKVPLSEQNRMRCPHQIGDFSFPISYGYACVGKVIETQSDDATLKKGDIVFVLHPHQDVFCVPQEACNLIPDALPPSRAVLSANMETALNAVWDAEIDPTGNHMVIGAGVVGLLTAYCLKAHTKQPPIIIDIDEGKRQTAEALGLRFLTPNDLAHDTSVEMDRIFNTSASQKGLQLAIDCAAFEAKIMEMSWYGETAVTLNLGGAFHSKRLQIIASQVGHIAPAKRKTHSHAERMQEAMLLLCDDKLDALLEPQIKFETLPHHLDDIFKDNSHTLCQLVKYNNA